MLLFTFIYLLLFSGKYLILFTISSLVARIGYSIIHNMNIVKEKRKKEMIRERWKFENAYCP
jgi:predicted membrane protein